MDRGNDLCLNVDYNHVAFRKITEYMLTTIKTVSMIYFAINKTQAQLPLSQGLTHSYAVPLEEHSAATAIGR